jgi:hypothetical protein
MRYADAAAESVRKPKYFIPFSRNPRFVGRDIELETLQAKLLTSIGTRKVAVVGLGGIGKTQVALKFAYLVKDNQPECSIFWVPALSAESFRQACVELVKMLQLTQAGDNEDAREVVKRYLSSSASSKWLLVVDNADDKELLFGSGEARGLVDYLPDCDDGKILYTTRYQNVAVDLAGSDIVELSRMQPDDALRFVEKMLIRRDLLRDEKTTTDLLEELEYLPLAIAQAASFINTNKLTIPEYLRLIRNTEQDMVDLISEEFRDATRYDVARYKGVSNAIARTWIVSFDRMRQENADAAELLAFLCWVEWKAIPQSMLPAMQSEVGKARAIGILCAYSFLVQRDGETMYDMHRLVHVATRAWMAQEGYVAEARRKAVRHLAQVFPSSGHSNRELWRAYLPHTTRLCQEDGNEKQQYELCMKVGLCLRADGRIREAVRWITRAYLWRKHKFRDRNLSGLISQDELAETYLANGQTKDAIKLLQSSLLAQEDMSAANENSKLPSLHELAEAYRLDGLAEYAQGLPDYFATSDTLLLDEHPLRLASQHVLAGAYQADGQVPKAVALLEHVVAVQEKVLAKEHPSRLASQHELARAYEADGQLERAFQLLKQVVAVKRKVLRVDHPSRLVSQQLLNWMCSKYNLNNDDD